ncbi:MAG: hypothetical protein ABI861_09320 [Panacibacter sp.]
MKKIFSGPAKEYELSFGCVALLYSLFSVDLNVQVSDTTKMSKELKDGNKK